METLYPQGIFTLLDISFVTNLAVTVCRYQGNNKRSADGNPTAGRRC